MRGRYCVVTPYHQESQDVIARCLRSVGEQTVAVDHVVVADGHAQDWVDGQPVRHIKLDRAHGDYGNAACGIGAMLAVAEGYDAIAFLDADNWYDANHIETCLAAAKTGDKPADIVAAQRRFVRPDGSIMPLTPVDKPLGDKVDTNCFFLLPLAYYTLNKWCTMPRELSQHGDELFYHFCKSEQLTFAPLPRHGRSTTPACSKAAIAT